MSWVWPASSSRPRFSSCSSSENWRRRSKGTLLLHLKREPTEERDQQQQRWGTCMPWGWPPSSCPSSFTSSENRRRIRSETCMIWDWPSSSSMPWSSFCTSSENQRRREISSNRDGESAWVEPVFFITTWPSSFPSSENRRRRRKGTCISWDWPSSSSRPRSCCTSNENRRRRRETSSSRDGEPTCVGVASLFITAMVLLLHRK